MKTTNQKLLQWVAEVETLCQPDRVQWVDGSREEYGRLMQLMVDSGMATQLNSVNARTATCSEAIRVT